MSTIIDGFNNNIQSQFTHQTESVSQQINDDSQPHFHLTSYDKKSSL